MQAHSIWSPPGGALGRLCARAARRAALLRETADDLRRRAAATAAPPPFEAALRAGTDLAVIAEVKRRSPSRGSLNESLSAPDRAGEYERGGATAVSVLTEPEEFGGSNDDLVAVRGAVSLPVLRKDFHVAEDQIWEARTLGASAVLLIMRALGPEGARRLAAAAATAGIEALFEVRNEAELEWALDAGARVVGVNRRNLETLEMDDAVPARLLPRVPASVVAIAESGIRSVDDVKTVAGLGADAVLVGSSLSVTGSGASGVAALLGIRRRERHA